MTHILTKLIPKFSPSKEALFSDLGLLMLRVGVGLTMAFSHGLGKVQKLFGGGEIQFADPIGLGMGPSLFLAGFSEFVGGLLIVIGLFTRLSTIPLIITMIVAIFIIHGADPFAKKEFALLYLLPFTMLLFTGAGKFSVDHLLKQ